MRAGIFLAALLYLVSGALSADADGWPRCSYICDDPVFRPTCKVWADEPRCQIQCEVAAHSVTCKPPHCWVVVNQTSIRPAEQCASAEVVCDPASCTAPGAACSPLCEAVATETLCTIPATRPRPRCEAQCEMPACELEFPTSMVPVERAVIGHAHGIVAVTGLMIFVSVCNLLGV